MLPKTMTAKEWEEFLDKEEIEDISNELPNSFLMVYQVMRAKILYKGKKYYCSGWNPSGDIEPFVDIKEETNC